RERVEAGCRDVVILGERRAAARAGTAGGALEDRIDPDESAPGSDHAAATADALHEHADGVVAAHVDGAVVFDGDAAAVAGPASVHGVGRGIARSQQTAATA